MAGDHNHHESPGTNAATLQAAVQERRRLQAQMAAIEAEKAQERQRAKKAAEQEEDEGIVESQPLAQDLWETQVQEGFKTPHLPSFSGKTDPLEHLMAVGTQTAIVNAPEHLKCKLLSGTSRDVT
ncbi:hypothetical protein L195_g019959 [Trifolium pratense]|uniref:Uncharacterized protein n=1 Tax=Trifolium pratense TaxID=57577 RepID=A0A2K3N159_TRIPR|nr:hypothetical protein L195_g019959 [Trifolium pratense]